MADYSTERLRKLVRRLDYATETGVITWSETDRPQCYVYVGGESSVMIASVDDDGSTPFELSIVDEHGVVLDSFMSHNRDSAGIYRRRPWGEELSNLYQRVRRTITGVDEKLDLLLGGLPAPPDEEAPF